MEYIEELVGNYETSLEAIQIVQNTKIVLLVGISGAGKDTVKKELLANPEYREIVSHTTRQPRTNNGVPGTDGVEYHFVSMETAENMLSNHDFIEAKLVHGSVIYGTSMYEVKSVGDAGKIAITDVDVQGVDEYKELSREVVAIFLIPPSYTEWQRRLKSRYATNEEFLTEWPRRRASAIAELTRALELPYYHFIINNDLEETVRISDEIAHKPDVFHRKDDEARLAARDLLDEIKASTDIQVTL